MSVLKGVENGFFSSPAHDGLVSCPCLIGIIPSDDFFSSATDEIDDAVGKPFLKPLRGGDLFLVHDLLAC